MVPAVTAPMAKTPMGVRPMMNLVIRTIDALKTRRGPSTRSLSSSPMSPMPIAELNRTTAGTTALESELNGFAVK